MLADDRIEIVMLRCPLFDRAIVLLSGERSISHRISSDVIFYVNSSNTVDVDDSLS